MCGARAEQLTKCRGIACFVEEMAIRTAGSEASQSHRRVMDVNTGMGSGWTHTETVKHGPCYGVKKYFADQFHSSMVVVGFPPSVWRHPELTLLCLQCVRF